MSGEAWLYLFAVIINAVNLFLQVFFTIMYSDLEWYVALSPQDCPIWRIGRYVGYLACCGTTRWPDAATSYSIAAWRLRHDGIVNC